MALIRRLHTLFSAGPSIAKFVSGTGSWLTFLTSRHTRNPSAHAALFNKHGGRVVCRISPPKMVAHLFHREMSSLRSGKCSSLVSVFRQRRKRRYKLLLAIAAVLACNFPVDRRFWMASRSDQWFVITETSFSDEEWYENFRVSKETFQYIVSEIENEIVRKDTRMREKG